MDRIALGPDLELSRIVYGMWRLADDPDSSEKNVRAKIEACLEQGITSFDQADIYGDYESQQVLGTALKAAPALRDQMQIVTKCDIALVSDKYPNRRVKHYDTSRAYIESSVERSLSEMNIERIDLLLIHRPNPLMDHLETGAALDALVASGKVRALGVSNFKLHHWTLLQSGMKTPLLTNEIELSLLASDGFRNGDVAFLQERGIPPMAWSPLGGGALFATEWMSLRERLASLAAGYGVDEAAIAVAWLLHHPARILPVLGTNTLGRIRTLSSATAVKMSCETWFELYSLANRCDVP